MYLAIIREAVIAAGALTSADLEGLRQVYEDPLFSFADMTLFGAWGRRCL
jgi:hypothetical protein